uniref:Uncharacterized protein n=1 Tax=Schistosoma haematobium TaxID=6185 RepID=A0A094ZWG7_SCHHA
MLSICTKSEQKRLQCVDQLNDLRITNYVRLSGFQPSVRLFQTPLNYGLLDIQIPFTINSENHMNDMLNERYVLSNSSDVIPMSNVKSSVKMRKSNVHHPKYFNVKEALHAIEVGLSDDAKLTTVFILTVLFFQIPSIILYHNYTTNNSVGEGFFSSDVLFHMKMLSICTKSEQKWLQCVDQLNDLRITNYVRLSGFQPSVRLFQTPLNYGLLDIQIPFTINSENHMNDMLNERYVLSNSSDVIPMSNVKSSVKMRKSNVHHPKYFNVKEALHAIEVGLSDHALRFLIGDG